MNNSDIVKIVILSIIIVILLGIMVSCLIFKNVKFFSFKVGKSEELINESYNINNINNIEVDLVSADVNIKENEVDNEIKVILKGNRDEIDRYEVKLDGNKLVIRETRKVYIFNFWFFYEEDNVTIYVPKVYNKDMKLKTTSGDIETYTNLNSNMDIKSTSGDITLMEVNNLNAKTVSGEIEVGSCYDTKVESTSGDVNVDKAYNIEAKTVSGEITLGDVYNVVANSTSGDIDIRSMRDIEIGTVSGEVTLDNVVMSHNGKIKTTSGDVTINNINDVYVSGKSTSGDIDVAGNNRHAEIELEVKTTSGNVRVR